MSQPCSLVELILFDAGYLRDPVVRTILRLVSDRDVHRGAIARGPEPVVDQVESSGTADLFEFWLSGSDDVWPFERALSLSGVEPARTLFISANSSALGEANQVGLMAMHPDVDEVERLLL